MDAKDVFDSAYLAAGFAAQRMYPNEEFLRFLGRNYFRLSREQRGAVKVLEVGCGSGANLWMLAREGFDSYGLDYSPQAIALCGDMLAKWSVSATIGVADMTDIPHPASTFDVVADVFSAYCLDERQFDRFLGEVARVLKPGGVFFSYTPSKASDAFRDSGNVMRIDQSTVSGITRPGAPFAADYPFRFVSDTELAGTLADHGFAVTYCERVSRTYRDGAEYFEFVVCEAVKH